MSDTAPHPKQVEAERLAHHRQAKRRFMKEAVTHATSKGLHFLEIAPTNYTTKPTTPARDGRMTIAYMVDRRNVVMIATALCHPHDEFDKLTGRYQALENFTAGHAVMLRLPTRQHMSVKQSLALMLTHHTY